MKLCYLAKNGIISGPFTQDELIKLKSSGEMGNYSWMWQGKWLPTDPAPLEDPSLLDQSISKITEVNSAISGVCHDFKKAISGTLSEVTARGCVMTTGETQVRFQENSMLHMNMLIEKTKQSMNFQVRFQRQVKTEQGWNYYLQWSQVPGILTAE